MIMRGNESIKSAIAAHKKGTLLDWVNDFLKLEGNVGLLKVLEENRPKWVEMVDFPLHLLNRIRGPEDIPNRESLEVWERRVSKQITNLQKGQISSPLIVTDYWNSLEIADGNHRHEALVRRGIKTYWTIFLLKSKSSIQSVNLRT